MKDRAMLSTLVAIVAEIHNREVSELLLEAYWQALAVCSDEDVKRAFQDLIRESPYFPKPADIIAMVRSYHDNWRTGPYKEYPGLEDLRTPEERLADRDREREIAKAFFEKLKTKLEH